MDKWFENKERLKVKHIEPEEQEEEKISFPWKFYLRKYKWWIIIILILFVGVYFMPNPSCDLWGGWRFSC